MQGLHWSADENSVELFLVMFVSHARRFLSRNVREATGIVVVNEKIGLEMLLQRFDKWPIIPFYSIQEPTCVSQQNEASALIALWQLPDVINKQILQLGASKSQLTFYPLSGS